MTSIIEKYFRLSELQRSQFEQLPALYADWNSKINIISRKDIEHLEIKHVLHSLAIYKFQPFQPDSLILDIGTGGGFPGIPLAIMQPDVQFTLVDSIGKKINVVNEVAAALDLKNVKGIHERAEKIKGKFDFVVSRAVAELQILLQWSHGRISDKHRNALPNGLICLKGGDLKSELKGIKNASVFPVDFEEEFFLEKKIVYVAV